ncbi:MAG TPA: hypothetical protein ENK84_08415 [Desulfobulbus sp.]|nr:hypothetical protein [Desulfobulbus sp.]HHD64211.1 hypothetical protein [Desulfobulbaceae bacterium]
MLFGVHRYGSGIWKDASRMDKGNDGGRLPKNMLLLERRFPPGRELLSARTLYRMVRRPSHQNRSRVVS